MKRNTTKRSRHKKKATASRRPLDRTAVRYAFFRAFAEGEDIIGLPLEEARKQAENVVRIIDELGLLPRRGA